MTPSVTIPPAPHGIRGEIRLPGDKSISHRAVLFAALATGESCIRGCSLGEDNLRTIQAVQLLGVDIVRHDTTVIVRSRGWDAFHPPSDADATIDCGNSGTTMRLLSGILAGCSFASRLDGDASLRRRPMGRVIEPLRLMGATIQSEGEQHCAPLRITGQSGRLTGITYTSSVASAQVKSAILLAGLHASGRTTVREPERSRDHTERLLPAFGGQLAVQGRTVSVDGGIPLHAQDVDVPGDLSSAAFFIAVALLLPHSELRIRQIGLNPTRTGIVDIFRAMGAQIETHNAHDVCGEPVGDLVVRSSSLRGIEIDGELIVRAIDELPMLAVAMAFAHGTSVIRGAAELRVKESDRIHALAVALAALGVTVEELPDGLVIAGQGRVRGGTVHSQGDHRVAMALSVAGLGSDEGVVVQEPECIAISFPGYYRLVQEVTGVRLGTG